MKECVVCLPLTLLSDIKPGFLLTPFVVSMMAQLAGFTSVCCINLTGLRYQNMTEKDTADRLTRFKVLLKRLGIQINHYWIDSDPSHVLRLQNYCDRLANSGELRASVRSVLICQCGAVEVVAEAINSDWIADGKVLERRNDQIFCKLCNASLEKVRKSCLLLESHFKNVEIVTLPSFYKKEVGALQEFDQPLLVSRNRKSDHSVVLFGQTWQLDTDFCWSLLFCSLLEDGFQPTTIVVSNHNLKQLVWALGISRKLSDRITGVTAVVTPYVNFGEVGSQLSTIGTIQELVDRYGCLPTRLILGSALKWEQKEICVSSKTIFWALKGLSRKPFTTIGEPIESANQISGIPTLMDGNLIDNLITNLRKEDSLTLSQYHQILLGKENYEQ
jgi:hypothetical protein